MLKAFMNFKLAYTDVQEELLYCLGRWHWRLQNAKVLCLSSYVMSKALSGQLSCMWRISIQTCVPARFASRHISLNQS